MLSCARLVRSRVVTNIVESGVSRYSGSLINRSNLINQLRFQHSESIISNELQNKDLKEGDDSIPERPKLTKYEQYTYNRNKRVAELKKISETYNSIDSKLIDTDYSRIFDELIDELSTFDVRDRSLLSTRRDFSPIIKKLLQTAIKSEDPHFTPEYVISRASEISVCDIVAFEDLSRFKLIKGDLSGVLELWVHYLEYKSMENLKAGGRYIKLFTQLAYYESCANEGKLPDLNILKTLLQGEEEKSLGLLFSVSQDILKDQPKRQKLLLKLINKTKFVNQKPNSLLFLNKAHEAAIQGNTKALEDVYKSVLESSEINEVPVDEQTLVSFMSFFNKVNQRQRTMDLWNDLIKSGINPSTEAWNELLEAVSKIGPFNQRLDQVESIYNQIPKKNDETTAKLIQVYSYLKKHDKIEELITDDLLTKSSIVQSYIQHLSVNNNLIKMEEIFDKFSQGSNSSAININTYNALLNGFIKSRDLNKASALLKSMTTNKIKPDVATYSMIIDLTMKSARRRGEIVNDELITALIQDMKKNGIQVNAYTLTSIIDGLGKDPTYSNTSTVLFNYLERKNLANHVSYVSMIANMLTYGKIDQAEEYIARMISKGYEVNIKYWNMFFDGFAKNQRIDKVKHYYQAFRESGKNGSYPGANKFTFYFLLKAANFGKDVEFANLIFQDIENAKFGGLSDSTKKVIGNLKKLEGIKIPQIVENQMVSN
ncbi:Pentatricopeptide repeat-containing protein [Wickerhamomyces ciferrii]|uniref:Pentatricopeptide repeat-containing protein n=1 Tax=Wickerhamomyces ciferrii (strain ATCC 14091 / BCRC 22168 / CBS 111 / JCM 3599 / NBRC 0793 / NRRL Y-1031 F-60-10) TaxID=1206466 RepID=K0KPR4_WICCF|nr:Pentatricopeptide repeat-containing protein [Wickerhamomyces ciferrii]CCH43158.1 Pentatricopeptide repeat-containing protein [Wickerhamomyces ciferrii]